MYKPMNQRQLSADQRREIAERAKEWKDFRRNYLFNQFHLAEALHCCKRTIAAVESGKETAKPNVNVLRRFRELKLKMEKLYPSVALVHHDERSSRLFERRA